MITAEEITAAKRKCRYIFRGRPHHEHDDCIRMAYEWLDAQTKIKGQTTKTWAIKHIIETWCERYVSEHDVETAACLHPEIHGRYPYYNISARLVEPDISRLDGIGEAFRHPNYRDPRRTSVYHRKEGVLR